MNLYTVPKKDNMKKYRSIWCRLIIENINKIPRMLVCNTNLICLISYN